MIDIATAPGWTIEVMSASQSHRIYNCRPLDPSCKPLSLNTMPPEIGGRVIIQRCVLVHSQI